MYSPKDYGVKFCPVCKGHAFVVRETGNAHRFGMRSRIVGQAWTRTVDESKAARVQAIEPVPCENCNGTGFVKI